MREGQPQRLTRHRRIWPNAWGEPDLRGADAWAYAHDYGSGMRVRITTPEQLDDLASFLSAETNAVVQRLSAEELEVSLLGSYDDEAMRMDPLPATARVGGRPTSFWRRGGDHRLSGVPSEVRSSRQR